MPGLGRGLDALLSGSRAKQRHTQDELSQAAAHSEDGYQLQDVPVTERINDPDSGSETTAARNGLREGSISADNDAAMLQGRVAEIPIVDLVASRFQPRNIFNEESLDELAASVREHGLLEPLLVMRNKEKYEIICGERRYRAARMAGLHSVPCLIKEALAKEAYAFALIENMQRQDLNPLEYAHAMLHMQQECGLTQEDLARSLGISRSAVTNYLRLNNLEERVRQALSEGLINMGHAKIILGLESAEQVQACNLIIKKHLSVRQTEDYVHRLKNASAKTISSRNPGLNEQFSGYEKNLSMLLHGAKVKFTPAGDQQGKITLSYSSREQFEKIIEVFGLQDTQL